MRGNLARMVGTLGCLIVTQNTEEALSSGDTCTVVTAASDFLLKVRVEQFIVLFFVIIPRNYGNRERGRYLNWYWKVKSEAKYCRLSYC